MSDLAKLVEELREFASELALEAKMRGETFEESALVLRAANAIRALTTPSQGIPDNYWVLVPKEPTHEMLKAADDTAIYNMPEITKLVGYAKQKAKTVIRWKAMLAAAPTVGRDDGWDINSAMASARKAFDNIAPPTPPSKGEA